MKVITRHIQTFEKFIQNPKDPNEKNKPDPKKKKDPKPDPEDEQIEDDDEEEKDMVDEMKAYFENIEKKRK